MAATLNIYKVTKYWDDGSKFNEYLTAIVRAENELDAVKVLAEDDFDSERRYMWGEGEVSMIGWATGEFSKGVICIAD